MHTQTLWEPDTPAGIHHFERRGAKVENPTSKFGNFNLKRACISLGFARRSLFLTFSLEPSSSFMLT